MRANVPSRRSRKARVKVTGMLIKETSLSWPGLPVALPSPASPSAVIVSPETLSRHSSSSPSRVHRPPQFALALPCSSQPIPAVCYPAPTFLEVTDERKWKNLGCDALATTLSALYGKLLVVMGIAFPMAEVISTYIPPSFYEAFYLYLYFGSMIFLVYMYAMLFRDNKTKPKKQKDVCDLDSSRSSSGAGGDSDTPENGCPHMHPGHPVQHYGSFYLRMGAVAFGIGSMIYSGLEFGQYFERHTMRSSGIVVLNIDSTVALPLPDVFPCLLILCIHPFLFLSTIQHSQKPRLIMIAHAPISKIRRLRDTLNGTPDID